MAFGRLAGGFVMKLFSNSNQIIGINALQPFNRKTITLCGHFGENNYGDVALLIGSLKLLNPYNIAILTGNVEKTERMLLQHSVPRGCLIYSGRWGLFDNSKTGLNRLSWLPITIKKLRNSDILLLGPGSLLQDQTGILFLSFWFMKALLAIVVDKKFAFWGIGVGKVRLTLSRYMIRFMGKFVAFTIARDQESLSRLISDFAFRRKDTFLLPDFAILYDYKDFPIAHGSLQTGQPLFGVNFRYLTEKHFSGNAERQLEAYVSSIRDLIVYIQRAYPTVMIYFIPMCSEDHQDDRKLFELIKSRYPAEIKDSRFLLAENLTVAQTKYLISKVDCFVGTRLHSIVFSTSEMVPTMGISYAPKVKYYLNMMGIGNFAVDIDTITGEELVRKFKLLYRTKDHVRSVLRKKMKSSRDLMCLAKQTLNSYV
jgi:colanic acid/amylovoran biosynthesis protein